MVPLYAVCSVMSLIFKPQAVYIATFRDCYEAWIIYNFHALCLAYMGGDGAVTVGAQGTIVQPSWALMTCCLPPMPVDGSFLKSCKRMTLQFVLLKPVLAAIICALEANGVYAEGDFSPTRGYLYVQIVFNISYCMALYGLVLFYLGTHNLMEPFRPLFKFALIKVVVFFTFWQGFVIAILSSTDFFQNPEDGKSLQDLLICVEMLFAALCIFKAFPFQEFRILKSRNVKFGDLGVHLGHAINIHDVFSDTMHQFAPQYQDYTLYDAEETPEAVQKKKKGPGRPRIRTFVLMNSAEKASLRDNDGLQATSDSLREGNTPGQGALEGSGAPGGMQGGEEGGQEEQPMSPMGADAGFAGSAPEGSGAEKGSGDVEERSPGLADVDMPASFEAVQDP